jgi:hypothetical protein
MRTLLRWAARLYPESWRERYGAEFDALLADISPSFGDVCDVLGGALRARLTSPANLSLETASGSSMTVRLPVVVSLTAHAVLLVFVLAVAVHYVTPAPPRVYGTPALPLLLIRPPR